MAVISDKKDLCALNRRWWFPGLAAAMLLLNTQALSPATVFDVQSSTSHIVSLGIYMGQSRTAPVDLRQLEATLGSSFPIVHGYTGFHESFSHFRRTRLDRLVGPEAVALVSWAPGISKGVLYEEIAAGRLDPYLRRWARSAKAWQRPLFLRFAYEMNMTNMAWHAGPRGGGATAFVAAWRRIHRIFQEAGATNVFWVWCPHADQHSRHYTSALAYYPGEDVVDWVGLDGYYWGGAVGEEDKAFDAIFRTTYQSLRGLNKPMMIAEIAASAAEKDAPAQWLQVAFEKIRTDYPQVKAVVYFNENLAHRGEKDWRLSHREDTLAVLRQFARQRAFQGNAHDLLRLTSRSDTASMAMATP